MNLTNSLFETVDGQCLMNYDHKLVAPVVKPELKQIETNPLSVVIDKLKRMESLDDLP